LERALDPYRDRILYIQQENRGVAAARNTGIRAAGGPLIALLDSDDAWEPDYLAEQVGAMECDPTIDLIYPNAWIFGDAPEAGREFMELCPSQGEVTFERLLTQECNVLTSGVTARRRAIVSVGMFDESRSLVGIEDFDLWLRLVLQGKRIAYHRRRLVRYRRRGGSLGSDPVRHCERILRALDKVERTMFLTRREAEVLRRERVRFHATLRHCEGKKAFFNGDPKSAIEALAEANAYFHSRKLSLALILLRAAPRFLLRAYHVRDRLIFRARTEF
jgi:glycosyltransferase involved in cell wall biosynthesis